MNIDVIADVIADVIGDRLGAVQRAQSQIAAAFLQADTRLKAIEEKNVDVDGIAATVTRTVESALGATVAKAVADHIAAHPPPAGKDGRDGADGRDALDIDILPDVLPGKTYRSKTFARWRGGLIRSIRNTDPLPPGDDDVLSRGWVAVVNGSEGASFAQDVFDAPRFAKAFEVALND